MVDCSDLELEESWIMTAAPWRWGVSLLILSEFYHILMVGACYQWQPLIHCLISPSLIRLVHNIVQEQDIVMSTALSSIIKTVISIKIGFILTVKGYWFCTSLAKQRLKRLKIPFIVSRSWHLTGIVQRSLEPGPRSLAGPVDHPWGQYERAANADCDRCHQ